MKDKHRVRPQLESLESMTLLSGVSAMIAPQTNSPPVQTPTPTAIQLNGTAHSLYYVTHGAPDTGSTYHLFFGRGQITPIGFSSVSGTMHTLGNVTTGMATGTLELNSFRGSVTLKLTGPTQPGLSGLPTSFTYTIDSGTRKFKNDTGTGTVTVTLKPDAPEGKAKTSNHGNMTLVFGPTTPAV